MNKTINDKMGEDIVIINIMLYILNTQGNDYEITMIRK